MLWQQFKEWICLQFDHFPDRKNLWYSKGKTYTKCKCCKKHVYALYIGWK